jgi:hypothetical protein
MIVIGTSPGREEWANDCAKSLDRPYLIVSSYGYELGKIKWIYDNTNIDRFVFLQDSVVITDPTIFDRVKETSGSICFHHEARHMSCYLGVYERKILDKIKIPVIMTKQEAVENESQWINNYLNAVDDIKCFDTDGYFGNIEFRHGRENLIYTNHFLIKYRGDWGQKPITGEDPIIL